MRIPFQDLSTAALNGLIEEFVTRDGTDYGATEIALESKVKQIHRMLKSGDVYIDYDENFHSCNLVTNR